MTGLNAVGAWTTSTIAVTSTGTSPTLGTIVTNVMRYRALSNVSYAIEMILQTSSAGSAGSGNYLFTLPGGLTFNPSIYTYNSSAFTWTSVGPMAALQAGSPRIGICKIPNNITLDVYVTPYDATRFRLFYLSYSANGQVYMFGINATNNFLSSSVFPLSSSFYYLNVSFTLFTG